MIKEKINRLLWVNDYWFFEVATLIFSGIAVSTVTSEPLMAVGLSLLTAAFSAMCFISTLPIPKHELGKDANAYWKRHFKLFYLGFYMVAGIYVLVSLSALVFCFVFRFTGAIFPSLLLISFGLMVLRVLIYIFLPGDPYPFGE